MEWYEMEACNNVVKFCQHPKSEKSELVVGGILRQGSWAWIAEDNTLQIVSLKRGQLISSYTFCPSVYNCNAIVCVSEVIPNKNLHGVLLAVCLDYIPNNAESAGTKSSIAIYSVEHGRVLSCLKFELYITCMRFMPPKNCRRSLIQHFDGCLAIGTQEGLILTIDLYLNYFLDMYKENQEQLLSTQVTPTDCYYVDYNLPLVEIHRSYKKILRKRSLQNVTHFGVKIEVIESPCTVETLLPIDLISGLAAGLEDGRLVIYDMSEMQIIYVSEEHELSPLIKMDFVEPPDDPRACFYILTLHGNGRKVVKCLFVFMYEKRLGDESGNIFFENFQYGAMKLEMLLESNASMVITCQAITKPPKNADDDATCLFAISWNSMKNEETKLLVFDINQWYKEEMPRTLVGEQAKSCLATFILKNHKYGLDAFLNPATICYFNSMQRCEEHFYPNSLSFDWLLLEANGYCAYNWAGIQNKIINILRASSASLFLEPDVIFEKIREARLLPQFTELNVNALFSQKAKYEVLLSVALEQNCIGLLRDCARCWADGSFTGINGILHSSGVELSLQTLKNWIWKRASDIKMRCNELCDGLLGSSGHPLDLRERKESSFITRQLRNLANIFDEVMHQNSKQQPQKAKDGSLHFAADYQELLIWLINIGLLPETSQRFRSDDQPTTSSLATKTTSSIYPYKQLRDYYVHRRSELAKIDESYISKKSGSCRLIFIDAFIEHECMRHSSIDGTRNSDNLREHWLQNDGNGLYPPANIESMLRIMLLSNVNFDSKCAILFYFFLDLHVALTDGDRHDGADLKEMVGNFLKFPSVFKLSPSLTKTLQAFWHLDHGNIVDALDEFLSPFNNNRKMEQWLIELLLESLLLQNGAHLALRILHSHSSLIAPHLRLNTLLVNNLIAEAFHFVRSKDDDDLMKRFFTNCLRSGKLSVIRDLSLNEHEGKLVENLLKRIQLPGAENLHLVYLLQKSKYIEAVSFMDELSKEKSIRYGISSDTNEIDAPNLVISAFHTTMAPVTKSLTEVYFRIRNKIKQKETQDRSPVPLSCQLIKQNANNLLGGIYHSSALSAHFATCYYDEELQFGRRNNNKHSRAAESSPLSANNAPFLRKPQTETCREAIDMLDRQTLSYPQEFKLTDKRRISDVEKEDTVDTAGGTEKPKQLSKKRRLHGEDFLSGFKHFQQKNITLNDTGLNLTSQVNNSFLTQPLTAKQLNQSRNIGKKSNSTNDYAPAKELVCNELHGILKSNTPEPTELRARRGETPANEEKTLRFILPTTETNQHENEKIELDVQKEKNAKEISEPEVRHRAMTRSISQESNIDDVNMTEYYSTLSTLDQVNTTTSNVATTSIKDSGISLTAKNIDSQESAASLYQSARCKSLSPNSFGPKPRKALLRISADPEQPSRNQVTEKKHLLFQNVEANAQEISSGLGLGLNKEVYAEDAGSLKSHNSQLFKITTITTLASAEFAPKICSSKVGETQAKLVEDLKMSERSTIVMTSGSVCDMDLHTSIHSESEAVFIQPRAPLASIPELKNVSNDNLAGPSLDTTLGMSSYDITDLDPTAVGTVNEEKEKEKDEDVYLLEPMTNYRNSSQTDDELHDDISNDEISEQSPEVIELLSSNDEQDIDASEAESSLEYDEESSVFETESNHNFEVDSRDTNQETTNSNETVQDNESDEDEDEDEDEELYTSDSNDIVLQQEDSDTSESGSSNQEIILIEEDNIENPETSRLSLPESSTQSQVDRNIENEPSVLATKSVQNSLEEQNKLPESSINSEKQAVEQRKVQNLESFVSTDSNSEMQNVEYVERTEEKLVEILPQKVTEKCIDTPEKILCEPSELKQSKAFLISQTEKQSKDIIEPLEKVEHVSTPKISDIQNLERFIQTHSDSDSQIVRNVEKMSEKLAETSSSEKAAEKDYDTSESDMDFASNELQQSEDIKSLENVNEQQKSIQDSSSIQNLEKFVKIHSKADSEIVRNVEKMSQKAVEKDSDDTPEINMNVSTDNSFVLSKEPDKVMAKTDNTASNQIHVELNTDGTENTAERKDAVLEESPIAIVKHKELKESKDEKNTNKLDTSDCFETPNASFNSVKQVDGDTPKIEDKAVAGDTSNIAVKEVDGDTTNIVVKEVTKDAKTVENPIIADHTDELQTISSTKSFQKSSRRGQSLPPQPLLTNEESLETDSQTPKRRSNRGISVPPQTIESITSTPRGQKRVALSGRHKTINEEGESPQSPNSSRSGRDSQQKRRSLWESGGAPQIDSPALRTRSRMRTISETSDATANSLNSPTVSAKKPRRTSISSTISEQQQQHILTPKRTRRGSTSGKSDKEGTPQSRRLLIKEVEAEEEAQKVEESNAAIDIYSSSRRLTRTQRALLEKSEHKSTFPENTKDDQVSVSSRISQTSARSKRHASRTASVKSNDDDDDDLASVTSSVGSEARRSSRRLRAQQQQSPSTNLSTIPEVDNAGGTEPPSKRNKSVKK